MSVAVEYGDRPPEGWVALARRRGSFYHEPVWLDMLRAELGVRPRYFSASEHGRLIGIMPVGEVRGLNRRRRLVSLPFSYAAGPVAETSEAARALVAGSRDAAQAMGLSAVEIKSLAADLPDPAGFHRVLKYSTYIVGTSGGEDATWQALHADSTRRGVRRAERDGVKVVQGSDRSAWRTLARLQEATSHAHGLPAPPRAFFERGCAALQEQGLVDLLLAELGGRVIAGMVLWKGARRWIYAFGPSVPAALEHRPVHLLMWTAIKQAIAAGAGFDLGRAAPEQKGLVEFKKRWGGMPVPLAYDYWPVVRGLNALERDRGSLALASRVWRALPAPVARAGSFLYRYLG